MMSDSRIWLISLGLGVAGSAIGLIFLSLVMLVML